MLVLGDLDGLSGQPAGEWVFDSEATILDPFCIRYVAKELSELYVQTQGRLTGPFRGFVTLAEGENITLAVRTEEDLNCLYPTISGSGTEVVINAVDPTEGLPCIRDINGVKPDNSGGITFIGQNCLEIKPGEVPHTLIFNDTCAEPCCSCAELVPIEDKIKEISDSIRQLTSRMETLHTQHEFMLHALSAAS